MLTHIDAQGRPAMVGVGDKAVTRRMARAVARVHLPAPLAARLQDNDIATKKGSVFHTAILAGIMGAKRTSDLIPLCHPLPPNDCKVTLTAQPPAPLGYPMPTLEEG